MKIVPSRLAVSLFATAIALPALAQNVATVGNGTAIPQSRADVLVTEQKNQGAPDSDQLRAAIKEELIRREVLYPGSPQEGPREAGPVQAQMELARQAVLIRAYLQDYVKAHPVSDADVKSEYDKIKTQLGDKEYKARHILVEKEEDAKAIIAKLDKGEKIEDLAKQSKDPGSKDKGGDLGWGQPGRLREAFRRSPHQAREGQEHRRPGQDRLRLPRHQARRQPPPEGAALRRGEGPAQAAP